MNFYNNFHLGDNIYSLIFLNNIIENNNIKINYSFRGIYNQELNRHNYKNINFKNALLPKSINTWIQANNVWGKYNQLINKKGYCYYDDFYLHFYKDLANRNNLKHSFKEIRDTLYYHPDLEERRYDDYDFFIMNSRGFSDQYKFNNNDFKKFVEKLDGKVITTQKIPGYESTMEKGMSLLDIANLAIGCKYIIGVHTAPYSTALNKKSVDTVKKWVVLNDKNISYKIKDDFLSYKNILDVNVEKIIDKERK